MFKKNTIPSLSIFTLVGVIFSAIGSSMSETEWPLLNAAVPKMEYKFSLTPKMWTAYDIKLWTAAAADMGVVYDTTDIVNTIRVRASIFLDGELIAECRSGKILWFGGNDSGFYCCSMAAYQLDRAQDVKWNGGPPPWERPLLIPGKTYDIIVTISGQVREFSKKYGEVRIGISPSVWQK